MKVNCLKAVSLTGNNKVYQLLHMIRCLLIYRLGLGLTLLTISFMKTGKYCSNEHFHGSFKLDLKKFKNRHKIKRQLIPTRILLIKQLTIILLKK